MTMIRDDDYDDLVDDVHATFVDRMTGYLARVASRLNPGSGLLADADRIIDLSSDEYRYDMAVTNEDGEIVADVSVILLEERVTEGDPDATRFAFSVSAHEYGGSHLGTCCPYNFTEWLWVEAGPALEERWSVVEGSADDLAGLLLVWAAGGFDDA